ncbi:MULTISPECIES: hypothetical protein [Sinorhizobium]|uniref:hypothetical protein n=1 Tax=Sinorhizobium TaxID=28105 RepID=UPI0011A3EA04|nr:MULTISPECIES: hypothetical protein [Sinorhizobium]MDW9439222.1 hypothetical protein [Sinorhizobium meliloti]MDW9484045.1 hypothetical protein [Sinorhizobium meliloti]MDX0525161.1 hypothetical protein [Sinorhizobium medicae]MDX0636681.1 hypothetical protein [Sinorhizobium medicae]MQV61361.1 hypothetical protein [Sinorhizobium meliloti]
MTIVVAWTRKVGPATELLVASDSRLTSAGHVDVCQKVFPLSRGDAFFAFCGDTALAFPLIFQINSAIANYQPAADRREDVPELLNRILTLLNAYREAWKDTDAADHADSVRTTRFLFGGWSWRQNRFRIYPIQYSREAKKFRFFSHSKQSRRLGLPEDERCYIIGDYAAEFRSRLRDFCRISKPHSLDYEPARILSGMLKEDRFINRRSDGSFYNRNDKAGAIGGAPQILKVYQHVNFRPIAVRWQLQNGEPGVSLYGRPLFEWEKTFSPIFNPATGDMFYPLATIVN